MKKLCLLFRKSMSYLFVVCMVVCFLPKPAVAQQNSNLFIVVDLMKVKPGNDVKYLELEQNVFKPIHQERINQGIIVAWFLYQVVYVGDNDPYNYVTVNVYADPTKLETPYAGIDFNKILPGKDLNLIMEETVKARTIVQEQLMRRVNFAYPEGGENLGPHKYIVVNYMKTKPGGNYVQLENQIGQPTAAELVKSGAWSGWTFWSNVYPSGTNMAADYVTVDYYSDFTKVGSFNYMEAFQKAHPDKEWAETMQGFSNSRDMIRTELWKLLDAAIAE
ncbi:hypothetical protein [uncultured Draconibacterium sp.]|uniref:hypothetical protein n=1 Tax=uncultured Draconibacterium sp. TaxID=1573823 RepID=UPI0025F214A6|nr:hypothetical protein [uncultured Draconibacterium sp.]